jgi:hypothetical protein
MKLKNWRCGHCRLATGTPYVRARSGQRCPTIMAGNPKKMLPLTLRSVRVLQLAAMDRGWHIPDNGQGNRI